MNLLVVIPAIAALSARAFLILRHPRASLYPVIPDRVRPTGRESFEYTVTARSRYVNPECAGATFAGMTCKLPD